MGTLPPGFIEEEISKNVWFNQSPPPTFVGTYLSREKDGNCACGVCNAFDADTVCAENHFTKEWVPCCGGFCRDSRLCVPPQKQFCYLIDGQPSPTVANAVWKYPPGTSAESSGDVPDLFCRFDTNLMTPRELSAYRTKFGKNANYFAAWQSILKDPATVCLESGCRDKPKRCNVTPAGKNESCSVLSEDSERGRELRLEFLNLTPQERTEIVKNVCSANLNFDDCACFNRLRVDPLYESAKAIHSYDDRCWYLPCVDDLSLSHYLEQSEKPTECPKEMCQIIINAARDRDVKIQDIQNRMNCVFDGSPNPVPPPPPPPPVDGDKGISLTTLVIIVVFIVLFFVLIVRFSS